MAYDYAGLKEFLDMELESVGHNLSSTPPRDHSPNAVNSLYVFQQAVSAYVLQGIIQIHRKITYSYLLSSGMVRDATELGVVFEVCQMHLT